MINISNHIISLLYEHDCVIVPGLGAFLAQRVPAKYDEQRGLMLPPRKDVLFNSQIRHTDGLLTDFVAKQENMDFDSAARIIEEFVDDTSRNLSSGTTVMLPELGILRVSGGVVVFEPANGLNLLAESYGFAPVAAQAVSQPSFLRATNLRKYGISAAVIAGMLLISPRTSDVHVVQADISSSFSSIASQHTDKTFSSTEEEPQAEEEVPQMVDYYCLVVASFTSQDDAELFISQMLSRGVSGLDVIANGGRYRVITARFSSQDEANVANQDVRAVAGFEHSWVLHVEQPVASDSIANN